jgi:hypothetical protein
MNKNQSTVSRGVFNFVWRLVLGVFLALVIAQVAQGANVYVSRFWHNHQPIYWPEWNGNGSQTERIQYAWDSIVLKDGQKYSTAVGHPENNLTDIFGLDDRRSAYQGRPRDSLAAIGQAGGFCMSYSGSLMDNVRNLGGNNQLGYGSGWWDGNRQASGWLTPSGSRRLDLVGFTYHHSLGAVLPKSVFRKELQIFKQAYWKAWNRNSDLSDHSKGFFPTEMAFSPAMVDVLADEGYEWVIVASHHLSRTCPTYNNYANPTGTYNIYSSPPNRADQLGPSPSSGWWYNMPNPGQGSWNVSPYAYQLQRVKYVNPSNGTEKTMIMVPSDDTLSYMAGYSGAQVGIIDSSIAPYANDPSRPVIVMPSTDGDNAWGGGFSSWIESTPAFFSASQNAGYNITAVQDFVNQHGAAAPVVHVEDGAWIFPETDYGSPYFLKWIEPPLKTATATNTYPGTMVDIETPGFALKFWSWSPVIAGANWCETAEQIFKDAGGAVNAWKVQSPYDWDGSYMSPNIVERAWHVYLGGLDSGFNYYGGLGNDDEVKQSLATRRAVEMLQTYMSTNLANDRTPPTVFKPQRFPWNPGAYTFGWFNSIPGGGTNSAYLKKMPSEFYVWTHAYDVSGITNIVLKIRKDNDGVNSLANNQNEVYSNGADVGSWISISMTKRTLPSTQAALNAAANNGQIDYFPEALSPSIADYYFAKITDSSVPSFRGKLLDYYIEANDGRGNVSKSDIQHVFVESDGGQSGPIPSAVNFSSDPRDCADLTTTYMANGGSLSNLTPVTMWLRFTNSGGFVSNSMAHQGGGTSTYTVAQALIPDNAPLAEVYFQSGAAIDNNGGANWSTTVRDCNAPTGTSSVIFSNAAACDPVNFTYFQNAGVLQTATQIFAHVGYGGWAQTFPSQLMTKVAANVWRLSVTPPQSVSQLDVVFHNASNTWDNNGGVDWHFTLNVCEAPVTPPGITITNPPNNITVGGDITVYTLQGLVSEVTDLMSWTNSLNGANGILSVASPWSIANVPLALGANVITVTGTNSGFSTMTNASDSGADIVYTNGWDGSDTGGSGFGAWQLYTSTNDQNQAGRFMGSSAAVNIGTPAWGLYANSGQLSEAKRRLTNAMAVGQTMEVMFDHGFLDPGTSAGVALQNNSGDTLWQFYFHGGKTNYDITGSSSDIQWTPGGHSIEVTLTGPTSYVSRITPLGGTTRTNTGTLFVTNDMSIVFFRAWNWNAGAGSDYDVFFNSLRLITANAGSGSSTSDTVTITRQTGITDTNTNGIPDSWELKYFGTITGAVADVDTDGDGALNKDEFVADTNPTNVASVYPNLIEEWIPGIVVMTLQAGSPTTNSRIYDVWVSTNLMTPSWSPRYLNVPGALNGGPITLVVTNVGELGYYRTGVKLP